MVLRFNTKINTLIHIVFLFIWVIVFYLPGQINAQPSTSEIEAGEYQIKAAYLYNFIKFVEWPDSVFTDPEEPIVLGILGHDPFGNEIDQMLANKLVKGRSVVIKRYNRNDVINDCHLLFISDSEKSYLSHLLQTKLGNSPILNIGDMDNYTESGGMVQFITQNDNIHFAINLKAVNKSGIVMSSRLLKLAKITH